MTTTVSDAVDALCMWLKENCPQKQRGVWEDVNLGLQVQKDGDRVLVTKTDLKKGKKLPVPPACILTESKVRESIVGSMFAGLDIYTLFSMFLLVEKLKLDSGKKPFWTPYINVLPTDIRFHPITYLKENKQSVGKAMEKYPQLKRALEAQNEKLNSEWHGVLQILKLNHMKREKNSDSVSDGVKEVLDLLGEGKYHDTFVWANCMVISRAFRMIEPNEMCMIPLADSMNHKPSNENVLWRPKLPRGFFIISLKENTDAGAELASCYHSASPLPSGDKQGASTEESLDVLRQFLMYGFTDSGMYMDVLQTAIAS